MTVRWMRSVVVVGLVALSVACASTSQPSTSELPPEINRDDPMATTILMQQGIALVDQGKFADGIAKLKLARQLQPQNPTVYNTLGQAELRSGDAATALQDFNRALELAPSYSDARNNRGAAYVRLGQLAQAEGDFLTVLADRLYANRAGVYFNLGALYLGKGNLVAAEENLRKAAVEAGPIDAYVLLGQVEASLSKPELAESAYRTALARAPERADIPFELAQLLEKQGRTDEAKDLYRRVVEMAPNSEQAKQAKAKLGR